MGLGVWGVKGLMRMRGTLSKRPGLGERGEELGEQGLLKAKQNWHRGNQPSIGVAVSPNFELWVFSPECVKYKDASSKPPAISSSPPFSSGQAVGLRKGAWTLLFTRWCLLLGLALVHLGPGQMA